MKLFKKKPEFDFMGWRRGWMTISAITVLVLLGSLVFRGLNFGVDFTGGLLMEVGFAEPVDLQTLRSDLAESGYGDAQVQSIGSGRDVLIRMLPQDGTSAADQGQKLLAVLKAVDSSVVMRRIEFVGPQVGSELAERGGAAMIFTLVIIMFYVMFRFQWKFSVGAVAALIHDVIITAGVFSVLWLPFDLTVLAALLTIIGYSLNDTIVVFDRIRENLRKLRTGDTVSICNVSINETLSRTINTMLTVMIVVLALFFFGGEAVREFSIALIIGLIAGTYSSVYIASAISVALGLSRDDMLVEKKLEDDGQP